MEKAQKISLIFLILVNVVRTASAAITDKKDDPRPVRPFGDFQIERPQTPTDPVPNISPSNRTGAPRGGFNEDIMFQTK
ncbi:MAG: hypothetical protein ACRCYZ_00350 [Alphaproteobacteria bacterium]